MLTDTASSKVTAAHLARTALLYVRQSSLKQVLHNTESAIRQYDLRGRAIALGWAAGQITVIDIDQGQSGASAADREGFQQLVAEVSLGRAGIVLGLECSRLARNSADWHQLLELCGMTGTLICDEDGLYDPRNFNDRLVLGYHRANLGGRIAFHPGPAARRDHLQGPPRRADHPAARRAGLRRRRPRHPRPRHRRPRCRRAPVRHLRRDRVGDRVREGIQYRGPVLPLAAPGRTPQGRDRLEAAGPPRRAADPAQPPLCRRVHLRPAPRHQASRREAVPHRPAAGGMDLLHPRRAPRIHHPGPVRRQPRPAGRQRRRARPGPRRRAAPRGTRAAAGHHHLRDLRAAHDRPLSPAP